MAGPQQGVATVAKGQPYFVDQKKGEINELKQLLRNVGTERDNKKKRDVIKKVIAYMTLGIDVSRLFTEMIMAIETRDLVVKKMVYLYLCTYARQKPDLAIMCINTLQRDCKNQDPMVRGLALRSLCSLHLPATLEYISDPLQASLTDANAYVRKTGVMGILKLWHLWPEAIKEGNMVDTLYNMLQDVDTQVVANCIVVLNEIMAEEGGMAINRAIVQHLLERLESFNEWGVCHVLALVSRYVPENDDEAFGIMNLVDPVLRTSNSGAVLAAARCFLELTKNMPDMCFQVFERMKQPLLTLMAGGSPEVVHCILKHLEAMLPRCPKVYDDEFRQFFTRYNEPTSVKYSKLRCLAQLADENSAETIIAELSEYAADVDSEMARQAIRAVGKICLRLPGCAAPAIERLIDFMAMDVVYVRSEAVQVMQSLLRKYPHWRTEVLPSLHRCLKHVDEPAGKAAVIWMVGEYGEEIVEAPYMLEPLVDGWDEEESVDIKMQLLTASMKLFFKRPPEMQSMLGRLLAQAVNDVSSQDLHDRALFYHRLLKHDPEVARKVICTEGPALEGDFAEERDTGFRDSIFGEFNTLSMVYQERSETFTLPPYRSKYMQGMKIRRDPEEVMAESLADLGIAPVESVEPGTGGGGEKGGEMPGTGIVLHGSGSSSTSLRQGGGEGGVSQMGGGGGVEVAEVDLLGIFSGGDDAGGREGDRAIQLQTGTTMDQATFQMLWSHLGQGAEASVGMVRLPASTGEVESLLAGRGVYTMASGDKPAAMKFFFYAKDTVGSTYLLQCTFLKAGSGTAEMIIKSDSPDAREGSNQVLGLVRGALDAYL